MLITPAKAGRTSAPSAAVRALVCAAVSAVLFGAVPAEADTIDLITGTPCADFTLTCGPLAFTGGTLTLSASNGSLEYKNHNGERGLGVSGVGPTGGEIDVNEFIAGTFSTPTLLEGFRVMFLYNGPEYGDPIEMARVSINGGSMVATLIAGAIENTATWSLGGATVVNCGATTETGSGCFDVFTPFGSTLVSDITFTAIFSGEDPTHNSDFSLASFQVGGHRTTAVPEPATLLLIGAGVAAAARRYRRA